MVQVPEVDEKDKAAIVAWVGKATNSKSMKQIREAMVFLCLENMRLLKEVNQHRAALGIEPLPVHELPK